MPHLIVHVVVTLYQRDLQPCWYQTKTICIINILVRKAVLGGLYQLESLTVNMLFTLWFALRFWFCPVHVTMGRAECPEGFPSLHGSWDGVPAPIWRPGRSLVSRSHSLWWVLSVQLFISFECVSGKLLIVILLHYIFKGAKCIPMRRIWCNCVLGCVAWVPVNNIF